MFFRNSVQGFNRSVVKAAGENWGTVRGLNNSLKRLAKRRVTKVERKGLLKDSHIAWRAVALQQSLLYRIVELGKACAKNWNQGNILGAALAARALLETIALAYVIELKLQELTKAKKYDELHTYLNGQTFSNADKEVRKKAPEVEPIRATASVKEVEKVREGTYQNYAFLCEWCHPNSYGHYGSFASCDMDTLTVKFSSQKLHDKNMLVTILSVYEILPEVEAIMDSWDDLVKHLAKVKSEPSSEPPKTVVAQKK